ncbi:PLDc N-terminal domain-containing protein [Terrabacter sp. C0L_2]|uniref:PLDc N-terminal domain-containing protein n=1 Tax=Terrabacter sp. C0L_2 TaxID=3108389 RepID=UPI002ED65268|nr:PLDc N-terminal domain-containing protein [Terrabacter sp. C0L_2]
MPKNLTARKKWSDLTSGQRTAVIMVGCVQLSLAAAAWADLARRPAEEVAGSKAKWAAIIAINWVGPIAYFTRGRRAVSKVVS